MFLFFYLSEILISDIKVIIFLLTMARDKKIKIKKEINVKKLLQILLNNIWGIKSIEMKFIILLARF